MCADGIEAKGLDLQLRRHCSTQSADQCSGRRSFVHCAPDSLNEGITEIMSAAELSLVPLG